MRILQGSNISFWRPWPAKTKGFSLNIDQGRSLCVHHKDMFESRRCSKLHRQDSAWTATVHRGFQTHTLAASDYSLVKELRYYASDLLEVRKIFPVTAAIASASGRRILASSLGVSTGCRKDFFDLFNRPLSTRNIRLGRHLSAGADTQLEAETTPPVTGLVFRPAPHRFRLGLVLKFVTRRRRTTSSRSYRYG